MRDGSVSNRLMPSGLNGNANGAGHCDRAADWDGAVGGVVFEAHSDGCE